MRSLGSHTRWPREMFVLSASLVLFVIGAHRSSKRGVMLGA